MKKIVQIIALALIAVVFSVGISQAATFVTPQNNNTNDVTQNRPVKDNLFIVGNNLKVNSAVQGDLFAIGNNIIIDGPVSGNIFALGSDTIRLNSTVHQDVFLITKQLIFNRTSQITGSLYAQVNRIDNLTKQTVLGQQHIHLHQRIDTHRFNPLISLATFLSLLVVGVILLKLLPGSSSRLIETTHKDWGKSFLMGVISLILIPLIIILLTITIIGIPLAILLVILFGLMLYLSQIVAGYLIGYFLLKDRLNKYWVLAIGLIILKLFQLEPLTQIISFTLIIFSLGLVFNIKQKTFKELKHKI